MTGGHAAWYRRYMGILCGLTTATEHASRCPYRHVECICIRLESPDLLGFFGAVLILNVSQGFRCALVSVTMAS